MDPPNQSYLDGMSGVGQLLLENEKTKRKLRKVQQRRDHYAKLYFQTLAQLEQVRAELAQATNAVKELRGRGDRSTGGNSSGHHAAHSNTTTPDSGTSLSPGVESVDGRGQIEGRDQREGPQNLFWSFDSYRTSTSTQRSPRTRSHFENQPPRHRTHLEPHLQHKEPQPPQHLEDKRNRHHAPPQQTPPLHHRNPTFPGPLPIKDDGYNLYHSAFSSTQPHFPMSPLQRRPPVNPLPGSSAHTLPHSTPGKPTFQRAVTLPHRFPPPSLKMFSSGPFSDDEDDGDDDDDDDGTNSEHSKVSAFTAVSKSSDAAAVSRESVATSKTSLSSGQGIDDRPTEAAVAKQPLHQHRGVSLDNAHYSYDKLSDAEFMNLLTNIGSPDCVIQKLEVKNSRLGEKQLMTLFCTNLVHNHSITELSLPENSIGKESLSILLGTIKRKTHLRELKLRSNNISQDCAPLIKEFLAHTTLDSLVLTGNEIEQYSHLMDGQLPSEFSMEYSTDGSEDSGVQTTPASLSTSEPSPLLHHVNNSFKYLRI